MTPTEIRNAVCTLRAHGRSLREISRLLALSRNTVRRILRQPDRIAGLAVTAPPAYTSPAKAGVIAASPEFYALKVVDHEAP